ncbi:hypothetical protein [Streptosporangium sandarakinum]
MIARTVRSASDAALVEPRGPGSIHDWQPDMTDITEAAAACGRLAPPAFDPARADAGRGWLATAQLR